jgi:hypothetical protein
MQKKIFRQRLLYAMLIAKLVVVSWTFFMWLTKGYNFSQLKDILFLVVPLFSTNLIIMVQYYLDDEKIAAADNQAIVPSPIRIIGIVGSLLYCFYMVSVLSMVPGETEAFNDLKEMLGWGEILFGVYLGYVVKAVFK